MALFMSKQHVLASMSHKVGQGRDHLTSFSRIHLLSSILPNALSPSYSRSTEWYRRPLACGRQ